MITEIEQFSISNNNKDEENSLLMFNEKTTNILIHGSYIEAQFSIENNYLVFSSHCEPYNEELSIYLLNSDFEIMDYITLTEAILINGESYLEDVSIIDKNKISFEFISNKPWILTILDKPKRLLKFNPIFFVRRFNQLFIKKYLKLSH